MEPLDAVLTDDEDTTVRDASHVNANTMTAALFGARLIDQVPSRQVGELGPSLQKAYQVPWETPGTGRRNTGKDQNRIGLGFRVP